MGRTRGHNGIDLERHQIGRKGGKTVVVPLEVSVFDQDGTALDVTDVAQSLPKALGEVGIAGQAAGQIADPGALGACAVAADPQAAAPRHAKTSRRLIQSPRQRAQGGSVGA